MPTDEVVLLRPSGGKWHLVSPELYSAVECRLCLCSCVANFLPRYDFEYGTMLYMPPEICELRPAVDGVCRSGIGNR